MSKYIKIDLSTFRNSLQSPDIENITPSIDPVDNISTNQQIEQSREIRANTPTIPTLTFGREEVPIVPQEQYQSDNLDDYAEIQPTMPVEQMGNGGYAYKMKYGGKTKKC